MMTRTLGTPPSSLFAELGKLAEPHAHRCPIAALIALVAHGGLALVAVGHEPAAPAPPPVDVELTFREPPPPPEPEKEPEPPKEPEAPKAEAPKPIAKVAVPPPAARAGAVLTAAPDSTPEPSAEPFDFTSDPNSHVYGSGVVAVGGTADHGLAGARVGGTGNAPVRPAGDGLTAAADLSQKPRLRRDDPCRGFFPDAARADVAVVSVRVVIGKDGRVSSANVVSESPVGQGFGVAARRCMLDEVFVPALDRQGKSAATALNVNVKFSR
jgi:outer membrane biosynthesis protein TonB